MTETEGYDLHRDNSRNLLHSFWKRIREIGYSKQVFILINRWEG